MSLEPTCDVATAAIVILRAATGSMLQIVSCCNCSNKGGSPGAYNVTTLNSMMMVVGVYTQM